jgi:cellulose synthase/poly-beta-1,6-N-acetylglucosamine synthase-like glycosyltransferase
MIGLALVIFYMTYQQLRPEEPTGSWDRFWAKVMLGYLAFVTLRSAVLVALSFADRFFTRAPGPCLNFPLVSVIVPCFNEEKVVENAVASILSMDYPNMEILVIDDGSTDLTLVQAKNMENDPRVRVIYQKNQGKAMALNRGIEEANGEYVMCVDADSMLSPDVIRLGIPYLERDQNIAAVAGSVEVGSTSNILSMFQRLEYVVGLNFHKAAQSFLSMVTIIPGPIGLFRRNAILAVGGYRDSTFAEDCDLSLRLLLSGYRTVYCADMIAITEVPDDFNSLTKQRYRWSRGVFQAIKSNSYWLVRPWINPRNSLIVLYMFVETLVIPTANFLFVMIFLHQAATSPQASMLGAFFVQLTLLDIILTAYSVLFERSMGALVMLAGINRLTYGLSMEVLRFFAMVDEMAGLPMNWNKLVRKGL